MRGLLIAAPASFQGKTTITLGLLRALRDRGLRLCSGKSGPDYIDPGFHNAASGAPCITLDRWAMDAQQVSARAAMVQADVMVVEGAMGLFDGAETGDGQCSGSTADLAAALGWPVILVVNARRMGQSIGALVQGFVSWRPDVKIVGVILNQVGSPKHQRMLESALHGVCPVLGVVSRGHDVALSSRHLGLIQAGEIPGVEDSLKRMAILVEQSVQIDRLMELAQPLGAASGLRRLPPPAQRIAVAQDVAFGFSYWHMLQDWQAQGAEVSVFSPLADQAPDPSAEFVFLPGGYPELHAGRLASAATFLGGVRDAGARGAGVYGECGGYMVLGQGLIDADGERHQMAGLLDLETSFAERRMHLGYRLLQATTCPWQGRLRGHEFHYAVTKRSEGTPLFHATDAKGDALGPMGLRSGPVMGSFAHVIEKDPDERGST